MPLSRLGTPLQLVSILGVALLAPASSALGQTRTTRYVAPTDETVTTTLEEGYGSSPSQVIWIRNASTVAIEVYSVTLRECENVKQDCAPRRLHLTVRPGRREVLQRVEPKNRDQGFGFRYSFGWRADSSAAAALRTLAENGSATARQQLAAHDAAEAERRATVGSHDQLLGQEEVAALGPRIAALRVEPDSVVVRVGQLFLVHQVHVLAVDSAGAVLGRVRAYNWRVRTGAGGIVSTVADTVVAQHAGRTAADFRLAPPAAPLATQLPIVVVPDSAQ